MMDTVVGGKIMVEGLDLAEGETVPFTLYYSVASDVVRIEVVAR
jgi:hypothetical protein